MISKSVRGLAALSFALVLGACANLGGSADVQTPASEVCAGLKPQNDAVDAKGDPLPSVAARLISGLRNDLGNQATAADSLFDKLLDCYVGRVDPTKIEQRLFRGHVIVTMLASYGAYNVGRTGTESAAEISATILRSITNAELSLSKSSEVLYQAAHNDQNAKLPDSVLLNTERVRRIINVLEVAIDVERPTYNRIRSGIRAAIAAAGGSPGAVRDLVDLALGGIKKATVVAIFGPALQADGRADIERIYATGTVTAADWAKWDIHLFKECEKLAAKAELPNTCVPSGSVLKASYDSGVPSRR